MARYLVTGGAGYVGSHVVLSLLERGDEVVIYDDLRSGRLPAALAGVPLVSADLNDRARLEGTFRRWRFDGVFHFAALSLVSESMREPMRYLRENTASTITLIETAMAAGCMKVVLSSTAALFGFPRTLPIDEEAQIDPVSAYGESKLMAERALAWAHRIHGLRYATLRYFNAAGADPQGRLGENHDPETHLIPLAIRAAQGLGPALTVFGGDYDTPDGTCIRDYVHVCDLADAHIRVIHLLETQPQAVFNIGNGNGYSVREVLDTIRDVGGCAVPYEIGPRRPGDPPVLVASSQKLRRQTGWQPRYSDLHSIVRTAWNWHAGRHQAATVSPTNP